MGSQLTFGPHTLGVKKMSCRLNVLRCTEAGHGVNIGHLWEPYTARIIPIPYWTPGLCHLSHCNGAEETAEHLSSSAQHTTRLGGRHGLTRVSRDPRRLGRFLQRIGTVTRPPDREWDVGWRLEWLNSRLSLSYAVDSAQPQSETLWRIARLPSNLLNLLLLMNGAYELFFVVLLGKQWEGHTACERKLLRDWV